MHEKGKKVFVGLSGGVDSSVSALLLKNTGYDVTGVFIRVWQPDFFECTWKDDRLDAMRVCAKLSIPFVELDLEKEYKKEVVDYMIREYKMGKTPNPDVMCNRFIKFGGFYKYALANGADYIATGHYARVRKLSGSRFQLLASTNKEKDQSYFLWQIKKEQLPHILFPVGDLKKPEVRKLAKKFGLITADKKDSQGLCFIGKVDMKEFLSYYIKPKKGKVLDEHGKVIGGHEGVEFVTIGERLSFEAVKSCKRTNVLLGSQPYYVIGKDVKKNTLTVSQKSPQGVLDGTVTEVAVRDCNWLTAPQNGKAYNVRTRYRQSLQQAVLKMHNSKFILRFVSKQTVAPGQSLVLYDGDILIGGGSIA
ncbi:MAG: tRNA 2-thiouridine(34) synthase MnmA [Candidatus Taylorbacteria bacterium]|nr:tRNA 2-thiouridine(34) synthase MnmA [Candidatus Taylorbacteria bacterium]